MAYGYGTKSWRNSTENRQMKQERAETTAKFLEGDLKLPKVSVRDFLCCRCRSFRYPHTLDAHAKLKSDHDWRPFEVRERGERASAGWQEWSTVR